MGVGFHNLSAFRVHGHTAALCGAADEVTTRHLGQVPVGDASCARLGAAAPGMLDRVTIGTSLVLIAVGAILKYAVTADVEGFDIQTAGVVLMAVGFLGLILSLLYTFVWSNGGGGGGGGGRVADREYEQPTRNLPPRDRY
jgi:hypothetical protein